MLLLSECFFGSAGRRGGGPCACLSSGRRRGGDGRLGCRLGDWMPRGRGRVAGRGVGGGGRVGGASRGGG